MRTLLIVLITCMPSTAMAGSLFDAIVVVRAQTPRQGPAAMALVLCAAREVEVVPKEPEPEPPTTQTQSSTNRRSIWRRRGRR